jgi:membrane protein
MQAVRLAWQAAGRGCIEFYRSSNLTFASSIAYYSILSVFPFVLLILSIGSRLAVGARDGALLAILGQALPSQFDFLTIRIEELSRAPIELGLAGTVVALWASLGVFGAITAAVNHAWGVEQSYGFLKHKLVEFLLLVGAGVLLVGAHLLVGLVQLVEASWFAGVVERLPALAGLGGWASRNAVTPALVLVVGLIYYSVPNTKVRLRDVWFGAVLTGVLWRLAFAGFAWYVRDLSRFSVHGSIATVVVFLVWVYVQAVIFLYGVEVTAVYTRLRRMGSGLELQHRG